MPLNRKTAIVLALMGVAFMEGVLGAWTEGARGTTRTLLFWSQILIDTALIFAWVHADSIERHYVRSPLLNIGVIGLAVVFVPVYLVKSRPRGARAKALGGLLLAGLAFLFLAFCGGLLGELARL